MKLKFAALGVLAALLLAALFVANHQRKQSSVYILSTYPQSQAFTSSTQPLPATTSPGVFTSVWFLYGRPDITVHSYVSDSGRASTERDVWNWATQNSQDWQLTPTQMTALQKELQTMPPNAAKPTLKNLLVINFVENNKPATRLYDRSRLPPQVVRIYRILDIQGFDQPPTSATK